jgi:hypothetical protein
MTDWATVADVDEITGLTIADDKPIRRAQATLATVTGLIPEVVRPDITDRDKYWLKLMTCYQVAFMAENPDLFTRNDVTSAAQDGQSATFRNVDSHLFAPLARKAYRRLSWRALTRPRDVDPTRPRLNINSEEYDDSLAWKPVSS